MATGFDSAAREYDSRRGAPRTVEIEALVRVFEDCRRLLDLGGGTGRYAGPLISAGHEVAVLDRSRGMLAEARAKGLPWAVRGNAARLPFREDAFDGALFIEFLHLVKDWPAAIREVGRVTRGPISAIMRIRDPDLRWLYADTRAKLGRPTRLLDHGVNALTEILPPERLEQLWLDRYQVDAAKAFEGFENPEHSPADVHAVALEQIRSRAGSTHPEVVETGWLVVWNPGDFRRFAAGA